MPAKTINPKYARCCGWCYTILKSNVRRPEKVFCSIGCRDADALFVQMYSDVEYEIHKHYHVVKRRT